MSTTNNGSNGQPLTRRQLRELEAARQAQQAAQTPPPAPAAAPATGTAVPAPSDPTPAAKPVPPRRTSVTRPQTPAAPPRAPVTPTSTPKTSSAGNGPNRVSAATRLADGAGPTSEQARRAPASATLPSNLRFAPDVFSAQNGTGTTDTNITRRSIHQVSAPAQPAGGSPAVPKVVPPSQTSAIRRIDETGEMSTVTATGQAVPEGDVAGAVTRKSIWSQRTDDSGVGQPASAEIPVQEPAPAGGKDTSEAEDLSNSERAEIAEQDTAMMMAIAADLPTKDEETTAPANSQLPNWAAITAPDSDMPTDALPDSARVLAGSNITPLSGDLTQADALTDDAEPVLELDHSYTWLHYLILIAIAAVLGMVVWKIGLDPSGTEEEPEPETMLYSVVQPDPVSWT